MDTYFVSTPFSYLYLALLALLIVGSVIAYENVAVVAGSQTRELRILRGVLAAGLVLCAVVLFRQLCI